jgi:hypothetical protein
MKFFEIANPLLLDGEGGTGGGESQNAKPGYDPEGFLYPDATEPAEPAKPEPAKAEPEPTKPEPVKPKEDDDPYTLYKELPDDAAVREAQKIRRDPSKYTPKQVRAAFDTLTNHVVRQRLERAKTADQGKKYGDEDLQKLLADKEAEYKAKYEPQQSDKDFEKEIEGYDEATQEAMRKQRNFYRKELDGLRKEFQGIREPIERAKTEAERNRLMNEYNQTVERIQKAVGEHIHPFTIIDILRANKDKPEAERWTEDEIISIAQEMDDERFDQTFPKRLSGGDEPTWSAIGKELKAGIAKNDPRVVKLVGEIIDAYTNQKEKPGPEPKGTPEPRKPEVHRKGSWDPDAAMRGET